MSHFPQRETSIVIFAFYFIKIETITLHFHRFDRKLSHCAFCWSKYISATTASELLGLSSSHKTFLLSLIKTISACFIHSSPCKDFYLSVSFDFNRMGITCGPIALLVAALLSMSVGFTQDRTNKDNSWMKQSVPVLLDTQTKHLSRPWFKELTEDEAVEGKMSLGCHHSWPSLDPGAQERLLGYETVYENGTRTHTDISVQNFNWTASGKPACPSAAHTRRKRQVYGADGRFVISDSHFITKYPFSAAVQVSSGCSGILISPKHVLTAAHCIHNGQEYLRSVGALRVGVLQVKTRRGRKGRRRGGQQRALGAEEKTTQVMEGEDGQKGLDKSVARRRGGGRVRMRKGREKKEGFTDAGGSEFEKGRKRQSRLRRSASPGNQIGFRWTRVRRLHIPQGWIQGEGATSPGSADYNYAVLELRRPVKQKHMELGVAPSTGNMPRVHFSAYDDDRRLVDVNGEKTVVYRFCAVEETSGDMIYQRCDAKPGAAGAGVYVRLRQEAGGGKGKWQRRVIGVFSGHQRVEEDGGERGDYNAAVRITPLKYAQICHWIHSDPSLCTEI